jgi:4-amino-4-deoxy-L-arabinose transferase-like glycosyltransferase
MALYVPLLIISFHPAFILFSGAINNDVLSVAFMMGAVLCTLKWYDNQTFGGILKIALCVGLGMMTKLSAALVAPPIAIVFLVVFIKKIKTDGFKLFGQFAAFAAVCVPLGLWFEIKNYVKFGVPITYVQEMSDEVTQYIGNQSFLSRITDFSRSQFSSVFEQWLYYDESGTAQGYNEYNPLICLLKNSLFSESVNESYFQNGSYMLSATKIFFWIAALLAATLFVVMIVMLFKKCEMKPLEKTLFFSFYVVMIANFYKMCADYPFTCTMNFRYITPTVIVTSLFCGVFMKPKNDGEPEKSVAVISKAIAVLTAVFCLLSVMTYVSICAPAAE